MLAQLTRMGLPAEMLRNLTPEQKQKMFAMTKDPNVLAKAKERVQAQNPGSTKETATQASVPAVPVFEGRSKDGVTAVRVPGKLFSWRDEKDKAHVEVQCPNTTAKSDIDLALDTKHIALSVGGVEIMDGQLFQEIDAAGSTWTLDGAVCGDVDFRGTSEARTLRVTIMKQKPMRWLQIVRT